MMNKDKAVQTLSKVGNISMSYAEDLYDSFFPKTVIPHYIADYLKKVKSEGVLTVVGAVNEAPEGEVSDWLILENVNTFAKAWVNGYTVEGEPRYTVRVKGVSKDTRFLKRSDKGIWYFGRNDIQHGILPHTRKELEEAGFGEVFDNPMFEIEEVDDGND